MPFKQKKNFGTQVVFENVQPKETKVENIIHKYIYLHLPEEKENFVKYVKEQIKSHGYKITDELKGNVRYFVAREKLLKKASSAHLQVAGNHANSRSFALIKKSMQKSAGSTPVSIVQEAKRLNIKLYSIEKLLSRFQLSEDADTKLSNKVYLSEPFIKFEDTGKSYRPIYHEFSEGDFPRFSFINNYHRSPFIPPKQSLKEVSCRSSRSRHGNIGQQNPMKKKHPKYCELCKELYSCLNSHLLTPKHKKFSETSENFLEVDSMISVIGPVNSSEFIPQERAPSNERIVVDSELRTNDNTRMIKNPSPLMFEDLKNQLNNCADSMIFSSFGSSSTSGLKATVFQALELIASNNDSCAEQCNAVADCDIEPQITSNYDMMDLSPPISSLNSFKYITKCNNQHTDNLNGVTCIETDNRSILPLATPIEYTGKNNQILSSSTMELMETSLKNCDDSRIVSMSFNNEHNSLSFSELKSSTNDDMTVSCASSESSMVDTKYDEGLSSISSTCNADFYNCTPIDGLRFQFTKIKPYKVAVS